MSHKKPLVYIVIFLLSFVVASCNKTESDAKKAAGLTNKSIEYTTEMELEKAEEAYKESQEILQKYENHKNEEEFLQYYRQHRDEGKVRPVKEL